MNAGRRLALALAIAVLGIATIHDVTRLGDALPWRQMYDFADFYCAGQALDAHRDPYDYEPLHACEHRFGSASVFQRDPALAIPAPQPPYDFPAFMALARIDFPHAQALAAVAIVLATLLAILALARTSVPLDVAAIVLILPAGYVELNAGQIVPFALLFLTLCGAALVHRRDALAGVCAAMTAIEPHLGLPVILAALLFVPRARIATTVTLACLAGVAFLSAGPALILEYVHRVVPLQAAAEVGFPYQYSLTYALAAAGVPDAVARVFGIASFAALVVLGLAMALRLSRALERRELLVFFPAATAVMAGAYVHVVELCFAIPAAAVMAVSLRGWARNASAAALCALMVPWIAVWSMKKLFALSLLLCMLLLVRLQIDLFFAAGTLAALAAVIYAFELRPPVLPDAFRGAYRFSASDVVQTEWSAFVESLRTRDRSWVAIKIPGVGGAASRCSSPRRRSCAADAIRARFDLPAHLNPSAEVCVKLRIVRRRGHVLERAQVPVALQPVVQFQVFLDLSRARVGKIRHARAARCRNLLLRFDVERAFVVLHQREMPLSERDRPRRARRQRLAHAHRRLPNFGLRGRRAAQREKILPLRRRHDDRVPQKRLQNAIEFLLVNLKLHQSSRVFHSRIARAQPNAFGKFLVGWVQHVVGRHPRFVASPFQRKHRIVFDLFQEFARRHSTRTRANFREYTLCVLNSDRTKRGKVTSSVVRRTPAGLIESRRTRAEYAIAAA